MHNNSAILAAINTLNSVTLQDIEALDLETLEALNNLSFGSFAHIRHTLAKRRVENDTARETAEHLAKIAELEKTDGDFNAKVSVFRSLDEKVKAKVTGLCELFVHARRKNNVEGMRKIEILAFTALAEHGLSDRRLFAHIVNIVD